MCVGQGTWEEELLYSTRQMDALLKEKNVPAWVDEGTEKVPFGVMVV